MRSAATIDTGNVIVIVSPSAIFPLDGSITTPPASGLAFDATSSSSSSESDRAETTIGPNARAHATRNKTPFENRRFIGAIASDLGSDADQCPLRLSSRCGVGIARARLMHPVIH